LFVYRREGLRQQALGALGLGEGNHIAYGVSLGHHGDQAVQAKGHAPMRRRAVLQRIEQEAKLGARLFSVDIKRLEYFGLYIGAVDTHRTTADFPTIQHQVVRLGQCLGRIFFQQIFVAVLGTGERMVGGKIAAFLFVVFEHGEVNYPQWLPAGLEQASLLTKFAMADLDPQGTNGVIDHLGLVGAKKDEIAALRTRARYDFGQRIDTDVLHDGRLQAFRYGRRIVDLDISQALG